MVSGWKGRLVDVFWGREHFTHVELHWESMAVGASAGHAVHQGIMAVHPSFALSCGLSGCLCRTWGPFLGPDPTPGS